MPDSSSCKSKHNLRTPLGAELPDEIEGMWKKNFNLNRHDAVNKMQRANVYKKVTATGCVTSGGVLRVWCIMFHHGTHHWPCSRASLSLHELGSRFMLVRCAALHACVFWIVYLSVLLGVRTSGLWAHVRAEWQVEALREGAVMDRAATSDLRIGVDQSREGEEGSPLGGLGGYRGSRLLCTSCVPRFVIPNHLFCMRTCLCHESSTKGMIYHAKTKGFCH